jgi:hypothetical protein
LEELGNNQATTSINWIKSILSTWFEDVISNRNKTISISIPEENTSVNQNGKGPTTLDEDDQQYEQYLNRMKTTQEVSTTAEPDPYLQ